MSSWPLWAKIAFGIVHMLGVIGVLGLYWILFGLILSCLPDEKKDTP